MTRILCPLCLVLTCITGCADGTQSYSNCAWPKEIAGPLDLSQSMQARHLAGDAERAEDLAIRHADACCGPHSGHFEGMVEYGRTRDQYVAGLFQIIGINHDVTQDDVRRSLTHRRTSLDLTIILSFIAFYAWAINVIVRRIWRLYAERQETSAWVVMMVYASVIASATGVLLGEQWSGLIEGIRLGTGHLSYRLERIPWSHHRLGFFVGGVVLFWFLAALHHRERSASVSIGQTP